MKKIAIIGLGNWGKNLIRDFSKLVQVKTCVTTGNRKNLAWLQQNYPDVMHTTDIHEILKDPSIGAIVIATPINSHFSITKKALESKKHVFVEKPLTKTVAEAQKLIKIAKKNHRCLFVGYVFLYNEIFKKIKALHKTESLPHDVDYLDAFDYVITVFLNQAEEDIKFGIPWSKGPIKVESN